MFLLTEIQEDILKELFNQGIGKSTSIISEMLEKKIILSTPKLVVTNLAKITDEMSNKFFAVKQNFSGEYIGSMMILYGYNSSLEVIATLLGYEKVPEVFGEIERDALSEIGNIILTSCLCEFEKALNCKLKTSEPVTMRNALFEQLIKFSDIKYDDLLTLEVLFTLEDSKSTEYISMVINLRNFNDLSEKLDAYFKKVTET